VRRTRPGVRDIGRSDVDIGVHAAAVLHRSAGRHQGTLTLFLQYGDNLASRNGWTRKHPEANGLVPSDLARRFWFDTVNEQHSALRCACQTFGVSRSVLGTDWPMLAPDMGQTLR
jgi:hypothetical protein